jgi:lipopolysaccharide/colanic/teichoic acid biosynthesis glycosyltransferase
MLSERPEPLKRLFDVVLAMITLAITIPIWAGAAIAVRLSSPGPILYGGRRVGTYGKPFVMYKFRTMRVGCNETPALITAAGDARVTRVGRILRRSKIDELPQLVNVLRGEMSIVGPRPELPEFVSLDNPKQKEVLSVRPGITGPTQIAYRHEERRLDLARVEEQYRHELLPEKIESDLQYVRSRSLRQDLRLIMMTVRSLFS